MSKWGKFFRVLKIAGRVAAIAGANGVDIKGVPLDKLEGAIEKVVKDAVKESKKLKPAPKPVRSSPSD